MAFFSLGHFGLKPFVMEPRDSNCCSSRWTKWLDRFEICLLAADIIDKDRQNALLLLGAGEEVHSLFNTLPGDKSNNEKSKKILNEYFLPKRNKEYEIYVLRSSSQNPNETLDQYNSRLRPQTVSLQMLTLKLSHR